jgi:ComF family protein
VRGLVDLFFPPSCAACGKPTQDGGGPFCETCALGLCEVEEPRCARCGEPAAALCSRCAQRPPPFARAFAPYVHEGPLARAIHRFKYEDHPELAAPLAEVLAGANGGLLNSDVVLCAIPLHEARFRERKFDQAELLARALAKLSGVAVASALTRTRATTRQVGLEDAAREANVAGAFRADPGVSGKHLVLIDDVLTTGATARAAASALLEAGATRVDVLTVARAISIRESARQG